MSVLNVASSNSMVFQWHITDNCNLRCRHCYQQEYNYKGLAFHELGQIFVQLKTFVKTRGITQAHINLTGGEPFLRNDTIDLIKKIRESNMFSLGILSNGMIPSKSVLNQLEIYRPNFVQISLEGKRETNDSIRGMGSYETIIESLKVYRKLGIPTTISFTANSENFMDYPHVVKIARRYSVFNIWTDRYLPNGKSDTLQMTTKQFKTLCDLINKEKRKDKYPIFSETKILAQRALQFLLCGGRPYSCSAGDSLLAILSNGDLVPCRRLPIKIGNLLSNNINELYENSDILEDIRNKNNLDSNCFDCYYKTSCNGGLKCLAYATTGDYNSKDSNCWL
ncbi:radical SAM protein [Chitinispirillales bacterium ANBcel5]|uniref:radical SAM protein n=1 Tax=Cellulosispirillum alkaliphilum TaxID=3039283 RepID=UPI002A56A047|nr:radical SAM protein [Chitinispirillales bacterium ANBcel5]